MDKLTDDVVMRDVRDVNYEEMYDRDENGLNSKQRHFAELYMTTGEVGKSYAIAYGVEDNGVAGAAGSRLKGNPKVVKYIAEQRKKIFSSKSIATEEDILKFLTSTMTNPEHKIIDRIKSAELLGRNKNMFTDKIEISHDVEINLGFDPAAMIESSTNHIIEQKHKAIEHDKYYETEYEEMEDE